MEVSAAGQSFCYNSCILLLRLCSMHSALQAGSTGDFLGAKRRTFAFVKHKPKEPQSKYDATFLVLIAQLQQILSIVGP